jgi:hypothetical protein
VASRRFFSTISLRSRFCSDGISHTGPRRFERNELIALRVPSICWSSVIPGISLSVPSILQQFRGKKVGGHELISDADRLFTLVEGGELDQLDALYVSPETRG